MEIKKAYLEMIRCFDGGWDAIAAALGMSRCSLENRIYERKGQCMHVDTAMQMQLFSKSALFAEAIATASGGVFMKLPECPDLDNEALDRKFKDLCYRFGKFAQLHNEVTAGGEVCTRERQKLLDEAASFHRELEELLGLTFRLYCRQNAPFPNLDR